MTPEKRVETAIRRHVDKQDASWSVKLHADGVQGRGTLDLLGSYRGRPFLVEVKKVGGKATVLQRVLVRRAAATGYVSGVVASVEEFEELFSER